MMQVLKQSSNANEHFGIASATREGALAESARSLIEASRRLGHNRRATHMRACCVLNLFDRMERIFDSGAEPVSALRETLDRLARLLDETAHGAHWKPGDDVTQQGPAKDVLKVTANHYGRLFKSFSDNSYWTEPVRLLRTRLRRNEINVPGLNDKQVLDAGCGGGRYSVAWRLFGAREVVGLDASGIGIADARRRASAAGIDGVRFKKGDVLRLPFEDASFDIVFSNGVLHHTTDWQRGVRELLRVLTPGGIGWLYLIEKPGGLFWETIECLRLIMANEGRDDVRRLLGLMGVPANRVFYMLDHVMVPINLRLTPGEIEQCLAEAGAVSVRRLRRGADFDRAERIFQQDPYAAAKYGVGENRYTFSKA